MQLALRHHETRLERIRHRMGDMIPSRVTDMIPRRHRETRMEKMRHRAAEIAPFAGAAAAGAVAAFLLDPANGKSRRTKMRSMTAGKARGAARVAGRAGRTIGTRTYGATQRIRHLRQEPKIYDDVTLAQKIRSEVLGRPRMHAGGIIVDVMDGRATLRGQVKRPEDIKRIETAVRKLPGVRDVVTYMHLPDTRAPNKQPAMR